MEKADFTSCLRKASWSTKSCEILSIQGDLQTIKAIDLSLQTTPSSEKSFYFSVRVGNFVFVPPGKTIHFKMGLSVSQNKNIQKRQILLHEWIQKDSRKFQTQCPVNTSIPREDNELFSIIHEIDRMVETFIILLRKNVSIALS